MQSAREEIHNLERVRYVTENYEQLQGLKMVPVGILMLTISALTLLRVDLPGMSYKKETILFGVLLIIGGMLGIAVASLAAWVIGGRYERMYGKARQLPSSRRMVVLVVLGWIAFWIAPMTDVVLQTPVYPIYLVIGIAGIIFWWPEKRFRVHYLVAAVTFLIVGFLPLTGMLPGNYTEALWLLFLHFGVSVVVIGLLDHLLLVRTLKAVPED